MTTDSTQENQNMTHQVNTDCGTQIQDAACTTGGIPRNRQQPASARTSPRGNLRNARRALLAMTCVLAGLAGSVSAERTRPETLPLVGLSIAGPEFGAERAEFSNANPGKPGIDYTYNRSETVSYFAEQGFTLFRLPMRWERLQPKISCALDPQEVQRVRTFLRWAQAHAGRVILDLHNYGRYRLKTTTGSVVECVIDEPIDGRVLVSRNDFADFWRRIAIEFRDHPAIHSFGLMNEPHHMGASDWKAISQAAVVAIRTTGNKSLLLVAGDDWSSAERWGQANGPKPWINDSARRIAYEAHCYFDHDSSGKYRLTYDEELAKDPNLRERGRRRVMPFIDWCARNRVQGVIGEFATPRDVEWRQVLAPFLATLRDSNMDSVWWAAGDWWRNYPLSLQPSANHLTAAPQLSWILHAQNPSRTVTARR
jgi:endoglucanase